MKRTPALLVTTLLTALGLVLAGPVGLVGTASAAGTGDVELVPASLDGEPRTSFTVDTDQDSIRFELVNLADAPREARLYAASANRGEGGGVSVGVAGSAPWLQLPDVVIQLAPGEARTFTAPLDVAELRRASSSSAPWCSRPCKGRSPYGWPRWSPSSRMRRCRCRSG